MGKCIVNYVNKRSYNKITKMNQISFPGHISDIYGTSIIEFSQNERKMNCIISLIETAHTLNSVNTNEILAFLSNNGMKFVTGHDVTILATSI